MAALSQNESSLVLKNVSNKHIVSYTLACFSLAPKAYEPIAIFDPLEVAMKPGGTIFDGGFDNTPVPNECRSRKALVGIATVRFADKSSWQSPFMKSVHQPLTEVKR